MPSDDSFDDINDLTRLKYQFWTSENDNAQLDSESSNKMKVNTKGLNRKQEHNIVNQYTLKKDQLDVLEGSSKFKVPKVVIFILVTLGILLLLGGIAAILISFLAPKNYSSFNEKCGNDSLTCDPSKNLQCSNGLCICASTNFYWKADSKNCEYKKTYAQPCSSSSECFENNGLFCSTTASSCNCPATSVANMCECPLSSYFDDQTKKCVGRVSYGSKCTFDSHCLQSISLVCSSRGTCSCPGNQYFKNNRCNTKSGFGVRCDSSIECDETKGLTECILTRCDCPNGFYYDNSMEQCNLAKTFGSSCLTDKECDSTKNLRCIIFSGLRTCRCNSGVWSYTNNTCI